MKKPSSRKSKLNTPKSMPLNDNISRRLNKYVPEDLAGSDRYIDIVNWNIRYFNDLDQSRVRLITKILNEINADIFVLQEISENSLEQVAAALNEAGAGLYKTAYGKTGGSQRVAFLYDTEWTRTKDDFSELFADESKYVPGTKKRIFPRLPFHNHFQVFAPDQGNFDFHLVGVHLKAYMGEKDDGVEQRRLSANRLVEWSESETEDADILICGDFNRVPSAPEWEAFREIEEEGKIHFGKFNLETEGSHWYRGKLSRIDAFVVSESAEQQSVDGRAKVIPWKSVFDSKEIRNELIEKISDHMPVVSRFYFTRPA